MEIVRNSYINYQESDFISPLVESVIEHHKSPELISPLILNILQESDFTSFFRGLFTPQFSTFGQSLSTKTYFENRDYKNFSLKCQTVIKTILNKCNAIFFTTHADRFVIERILTLLNKSVDFFLGETIKDDLALNELNQISFSLLNLKSAIQVCETFKSNQTICNSPLFKLPLEIQNKIFSEVPQLQILDIMKIFHTVTHTERDFYQIYLPKFYNKFNIEVLSSKFSLVEKVEMAPYLNKVSMCRSMSKVMSFSELKTDKLLALTLSTQENFDKFLENIKKFESLESISIITSDECKNLIELQPLKNLKSIYLTNVSTHALYDLVDLEHQMCSLKEIFINRLTVNYEEDLSELNKLVHVKQLNKLNYLRHFSYPEITEQRIYNSIPSLLDCIDPAVPRIEISKSPELVKREREASRYYCNHSMDDL